MKAPLDSGYPPRYLSACVHDWITMWAPERGEHNYMRYLKERHARAHEAKKKPAKVKR